jgi:hypothetical protein
MWLTILQYNEPRTLKNQNKNQQIYQIQAYQIIRFNTIR